MSKQYIYIGSSFLEELYVPQAAPEPVKDDKAAKVVKRVGGRIASNKGVPTFSLDRLFIVGPHRFLSGKVYVEGVDFERKEIGAKNLEGFGNRYDKIAIPIRQVLDAEDVYYEEEELEDDSDYEESDYEEESGESLEEAGSKFYVYTSNGDKESPGLDYYKQQNAANKAADIFTVKTAAEMWAKSIVDNNKELSEEEKDFSDFIRKGANMWTVSKH